jgi:hypothetical protein
VVKSSSTGSIPSFNEYFHVTGGGSGGSGNLNCGAQRSFISEKLLGGSSHLGSAVWYAPLKKGVAWYTGI